MNIIDLISGVGKDLLRITSLSTEEFLNRSKDLVFQTMFSAGENLNNLANGGMVPFIKLPNAFETFAVKIIKTARSAEQGIGNAIETSHQFFKLLNETIDYTKKVLEDHIFNTDVITKVVETSGENLSELNKIKMSFRYNGNDISVADAYELFKESGFRNAVLFIPGLFADETIWSRSKTLSDQDYTPGLADFLLKMGYFPFLLRYNQNIHIPDNGKQLNILLRNLFNLDKKLNLNVVTYSQGGLVFRSFLYYGLHEDKKLYKRFKRVVFISSPDNGSYIEKIGLWLGMGMDMSPSFVVRILGFAGNLRSDGIKDFSDGIIREEDWKSRFGIDRNFQKNYFKELDNIDAYQFYSVIAEDDNNPIITWIGDGVAEKSSLMLLKDIVYQKKKNPDIRSQQIKNRSHFDILNSKDLREAIRKIFK